MKIFTADRECGNIIDRFETIEDAMKAIKSYEEEDKRNGDYTPDFYDVVDENNCSLEQSPEMELIQSLENINQSKIKLVSILLFIFAFTDLTYPSKISSENPQNLIRYRSEYEELSIHLKKLSKLAYERINNWKQICTSDDLKRIQKYTDEIAVLNADLKYFDKLYNEQISSIKTT